MKWRISHSIITTFFAVYGIAIMPSLVEAAESDLILVDKQQTAVATNLELYGGLPTDMTIDPTSNGDVVYITTYTPNGIFTSQNAGESWNTLPTTDNYGAGKTVIVDPDTGDVYVSIGDDLISSTDNGNTWSSLTGNLVGTPLIGSALGWVEGVLYVAVDSGAMQISSDSGETFSIAIVSEGTRNDIISIAGDSAGTVYCVVQNRDTESTQIFVSQDQGANWSQVDVESGGVEAGSQFYDIAVDPLDDTHLVLGSYHPNYNSYQSFDAGSTWSALLNNANRIGGENVVFDGIGGMYVGINHTADASVLSPTWEEITMQTPLSSVRGDIYAVDASDPNVVYSDTAMGVAKSEDAGASWVDTVDGISAVQTYGISQAKNKDVVWLAANGGLAKTTNFTDKDIEWEYPISPDGNGSSIYAIWVKPKDAEYVVTGSSNYLYYSEDGGDIWTQADTPDFFGTVDRIVQSPTNATTLYAMIVNTSLTEDAYNGGIIKSTDAGKTWVEMNFPTTLANGAVAVSENDGSDVVYVGVGPGGSDNGIYTYTDEWKKLAADFNEFYVNDLLVHPDDSSIILASFEAESTVGSLYKSTDAGDSWEQITEGLDDSNHLGAMTAQPGDTTTFYLAGQDGSTGDGVLYKSTDGGDSWSLYYRGKKQEFFYELLFDGLIVGNDRGVYGLHSLATLTLKKQKGTKRMFYRLTTKLRDAATGKKLSERQVTLYRKAVNGKWKIAKKKKTNKEGIAVFRERVKKSTRLKVVWKPKKADREEYTRSSSRLITIQKK